MSDTDTDTIAGTATRSGKPAPDKRVVKALARAFFAKSRGDDGPKWGEIDAESRKESLKTARRALRRLEAAGYAIEKRGGAAADEADDDNDDD